MTENVYRWAVVIALAVMALALVSISLNSYGVEEQLEEITRLWAP